MSNEVQKQLYRAITGNNIEQTGDILARHPTELNVRVAGLSWLDRAVTSVGRDLRLLQLLVDKGAELDPPGVTRTPLAYAVSSGSLDVVQYLLTSGANPNADRCIIGAINREQDAIGALKALIEHGVEINKIFNHEGTRHYFTATDWATDKNVVSCLRLYGGKKLEELQEVASNGEEETTRELDIINYFSSLYGHVEQKSQVQIVPTGLPIAIHRICPSTVQPNQIFFTTGVSSTNVATASGSETFGLLELFIELPPSWNTEDKDKGWPLTWLRRLGQHLHDDGVEVGGPTLVFENGPPPEPLYKDLEFTSWLLLAEKKLVSANGTTIHLCRLTPLYTQECELEADYGSPALLRAFDRAGVPFVIDPARKCIL